MAFDYQQLAQAGSFLSSLAAPSFGVKREIITVNGLQGAKEFNLQKGERVALVDSNDDILYIKTADDIGKISLKVYECKDITEQFESRNTPANISRAEFAKLSSDLQEMKSLLAGVVGNGKHNVKQGQSTGTAESDKVVRERNKESQ